MGKHAAPAGPEGREARRRLQAQRRSRLYPGGVWRYATGGLAFAVAGGFIQTVHEPRYYVPVLVLFGALLPLAVIDSWAAVIASFLGGRRERRLMPPRPRVTFLFLAIGWIVIGVACGLLASSAATGSTRPGFGADTPVTWLVWATVISGCAALMTIGRALPSGAAGRPTRIAGLRAARRATPSGRRAIPAANGETAAGA